MQNPPSRRQLMPHPTPKRHNLNKLDFTLPKEDSTQVLVFLAKQFFEKNFKRYFSIYFYVKIRPIVALT